MRSACSTNMRAPGARCRSRPRAGIGPGRAAAQRRRPDARPHLFRARRGYPELFYGQLALERLGRIVPAPAGTPSLLVTDAQRQAFDQKRLVRAVRLLGQQGRASEQTCSSAPCPKIWTAMPSGCWRSNWRPRSGGQDLAVWTARSARNSRQRLLLQGRPIPTHLGQCAGGPALVAGPWHHPPGNRASTGRGQPRRRARHDAADAAARRASRPARWASAMTMAG